VKSKDHLPAVPSCNEAEAGTAPGPCLDRRRFLVELSATAVGGSVGLTLSAWAQDHTLSKLEGEWVQTD
jgi:hypothetical protein